MKLNLTKKNLDLTKSEAKTVIDKYKIGKSQVVAVFDVSGSMQSMYRKGIVDALATRVLGLALNLDDDGNVPVYALNDSVKRLPDLNQHNINEYVGDHLKVNGGTNYSPTINEIVKDADDGDPMLAIVFTDGENFDEDETDYDYSVNFVIQEKTDDKEQRDWMELYLRGEAG